MDINDHCGGLVHFPRPWTRFLRIFAYEDSFKKRFALNPNQATYREIGIPWLPGEEAAIGERLVLTKKFSELAAGCLSSGRGTEHHRL